MTKINYMAYNETQRSCMRIADKKLQDLEYWLQASRMPEERYNYLIQSLHTQIRLTLGYRINSSF